MWYRKLSSDFLSLGYKPNKLDMCVFNRLEKDHTQTTLLLHVDDMKIMSSSEIIQVIDEIEAIYPNLALSFSNTPSAANFSLRNMLLVMILLICS